MSGNGNGSSRGRFNGAPQYGTGVRGAERTVHSKLVAVFSAFPHLKHRTAELLALRGYGERTELVSKAVVAAAAADAAEVDRTVCAHVQRMLEVFRYAVLGREDGSADAAGTAQ